jgi:heptosyltransferase-2
MRSIADLNPETILIVAPNWVGDLVMATPAIRDIRKSFPNAKISMVVQTWLSEITEGNPHIDEMILFDKRKKDSGLLGFFRFVRRLRRMKIDVALILPHSSRSGWAAGLSGAKYRIGYNRGDRHLFLTDWLRPEKEGRKWLPVPKTLYYFKLLNEAGLKTGSEKLELYCLEKDRKHVAELMEANGIAPQDRLILMTPGANFGSSKCWFPERFAEAGDRMGEKYDARVGLVYGPGEERIAEDILKVAKTNITNFSEEILPLGTLKALVERCDLMLTNDTGPRHFGVAFDKPVVVVMGSTDPRHTNTNLEKQIVLRHDLPCGPCHIPICPTDHECMRLVTVDDVMEAVDKLVSEHWR